MDLLCFGLAKGVFSVGSGRHKVTLKKIVQHPDASPRKNNDKLNALASQLLNLTLIVKSSRTVAGFDSELTASKVCSYCQESCRFSTTCRKSDLRKTRCASCGKLRHSESHCFTKQKKESQASSAEPSSTVSATLLDPDNISALTEDKAASINRISNGESFSQYARQAIESRSTFIHPQRVLLAPIISQKVSKKKKSKQRNSKQGLGRYDAADDVLEKLASASSNLTSA